MEPRRSLQTKTPQTRLSHGTFVEQPFPRSLLTTSLTVRRWHVYGTYWEKTVEREVSARYCPTENGTASGVVAHRKDKVEPKKRAAKDPAELGCLVD